MTSLRVRLHAGLAPRTRRLIGTAAASYLARFGSAVSLLVTLPLARHTLSAEMFGVWMMLSALLGFFSFADLGVGNGVLNRMTEAYSKRDSAAAARVMMAGYGCTAAAGLVVLASWSFWLLGADDALAFAGAISVPNRTEVLWAFSVFILLMALNLPVGLIQKLQLASQDGQWVGVTQFWASMGSLVAVPAALYWKLGLPALVLASLGLQVAANLVSSILWMRLRGHAKELRWALLERPVVAALLRTGALFFLLQLCAAFAFQSDAFVIARLLGQPAYGDFAAVQKVFLSVSTLAGAALTGLWPAFGEALHNGDLAWARRTLQRALLTGVAVMGALCIGLALFMPWLSQAWLRMEAPPPMALTALLALWAIIDTIGAIAGSFLNGAGVLRAQVVVAVSMATVSFAGKWLLVSWLGAWGAVLATVLAYSLISAPALVVLLRRIFQHHSARSAFFGHSPPPEHPSKET